MRNAIRSEQDGFDTPEAEFCHARPKSRCLIDETITDICGDRRTRRRYDVDLPVQFKVIRHYQVVQSGTGKTINLSGGGLACNFGVALKPGSSIQLAVGWPVMLNKTCPLKLVIEGKVVRSDASLTAVRMERYEFHTQSMRTLQAMAAGSMA